MARSMVSGSLQDHHPSSLLELEPMELDRRRRDQRSLHGYGHHIDRIEQHPDEINETPEYAQVNRLPKKHGSTPPRSERDLEAGSTTSSSQFDMPRPLPRRPYDDEDVVTNQPVKVIHQIIVKREPIEDPDEATLLRAHRNGSIAFSAFVIVCCNCFFGTLALFVALLSKTATGKFARKLNNIALTLNITGIAISWVVSLSIIGLWYFGYIYLPFAPWRISHYYPQLDSGKASPV